MDIPTFQIWCLCIHTPSGMFIITLQCSSMSIPLWLFFIFSTSILFIAFCTVYITHTYFRNNKFILRLTVQNRSETVSKFAQTFTSLQYHTSLWSLHLNSHSHSSPQTQLHTLDTPSHLLILTPHILLGPHKGWPDSRKFKCFCFMVFYLVWFRTYRHHAHINAHTQAHPKW